MILFWVVHLLHCVVQTSEPALFSTLLRTSKNPNAKTMDVSLTLDNARTCMLDTTNLHSMNMRVCGAEHSNTLSFLRERPNDFLFGIENTTLSLESLSFDGRNSKICQGTTDTFCSLSNCVVDDCGHHAVFESDGWLSAISSKFTLPIGMTSHGLVHSPSETCHFVLSGSIFQDWRTTERTSLTGTAFEQLDLSFSQFLNVSQTHSAFLQPLHRTFQSTSIVGCDVREVENDLYGSLSRDMNNHNLIHAANTTFSRNFHSELNAYTTTYTTTQVTSITLQTSFSDCLFLGCKSTTHGAGISHVSTSSLSVSNCRFEGCRAEPSQRNTYGGGIAFESTSESAVRVDISGTTFVSCYAHTGSGISVRHQADKLTITAELTNCHFEALSSVRQCACFYIYSVFNPSITNTVLQDCSIDGNSALAVDHHYGTSVVKNIRIAGCTTNNNSPFVVGSGITRHLSSPIKIGPGTFKFENCFFEGNKEMTERITGGSDLTINGQSPYASKDIFENCWTSSGQPSLTVYKVPKHDWIVTNEVIHVSYATGENKLFCWVPGSACKTMTDVIGIRLGPWYIGKIAMDEGEYRETKLGMKNQTLGVEGSGKTKTTMIDGGSSETLFTITTGQLTASKIQFVPSASSHLITLSAEGTVLVSDSSISTVETNVKLSKAVFSVSAGTLSLTGVDCSSLSFTDTTVLFLFSSLTRSLTLTNSSFSSISSDGSGSCICSTITTGQSVSIGEEGGSDSFSSCSSVGDGGALNVKLMDTGSLRIVSTHFSECSSDGVGGGVFVELDSTTSQTAWTLDLSGASFGTDIAKNTATKGQNLFLSGKYFETVVTSNTFPAVSGSEGGDMWGEDSNSTVSSSLLVYLVPISNTAIVGGSYAVDIKHCGHFGVGCVSIQKALNHVKTSGSSSLVLSFESGATLSESFSFETSQTVSFESASESPQTITVEAQGRFSVSSGTLSLNTLSFTTTVSLFSSSLISLNGGSLSVTKCTFTGFSSSESGAVVSGSLSSSSSLVVSGSSFMSCGSSKNGGAIAVECDAKTPSSSLVIKASFSSCSCGDQQNGDWVYVSGRELSKLIVPSNWETTTSGLTQPGDSSKVWGVDNSPSGSSLASSTLLVYLIDHSSGSIFTSSSLGSEVIGCGESSTPCKTLSTSFSHLSSAPSNTLTVTDSSTLDFTLTSSLPALTITGMSSPLKPLSVTSPGRFSVPSNELSLAHLAISPSTSPFSLSLFTITGSGSLLITSCTISGFSSSSSSKVLSGTIGTGQTISIVDTLFESCSATSASGIVELSVDGTGEVKIEGSSGFEKCTMSENGHLLVIVCSDLAAFVSKNELPALKPSQPTDRIFNTIEKEMFWGKEGNGKECSLLFVWFAHTTGDLHVHSDGEDDGRCGDFVLPCSSLSHSMGQKKNGIVVIDSEMMQSTLLTSSASTWTLKGGKSNVLRISEAGGIEVNESQTDLTLSSIQFVTGSVGSRTSPMLCVSDGKLTLISCWFGDGESDLSLPVCSVEGGVVTVTSCSFTSFALLNSPLIDHQNGELNLKSSSFSNIHRSEGSGSCLHSALDGDMKLEVDDVWMDDVSVSNGKGDGFFISFPTSLSSTVASFTLTNLHFASSPSKPSNSNRHFLFLTGFNLSSWIGVGDSRFSGSFEGKDVETEWLWTEDEHAEIGLSASLLFYLTEHIGPVGVDESGYDIAKCGYQSVWCPTLPSALAKLPSSGSSTVVVQVRVEINTTIDFSSSTVLSGRTATSQLVVGEDSHFEVQTVNVNVEVSTLVVSLPSELSSSCLFITTEGSLTLTTVSFVSSDPTNVFSSQLINSAAPLSLTNVNISSASLSGNALIELWSDVVVDGCHFTSISRSTGLGSVIEANISETTEMKVTDSTFEDCFCGSTVNWIVLKGLNTATKTHSSWEGSFSLSSPRSGVMVDSDEHEPFSLIFVLYPRGASLVVSSSSGIDHRLCGNESVPCETIAGSASESGERSFSVRGSCLMGGELMIETEGLTIEGLNSNVGTLWMEGRSRIVQNMADYPKPVTLRHVCVDVSSSTLDSESSILHLWSGTLDVSSCSFKSSKAVGTRLVWMTKGTLKLHTISLSSLTFSTTPIVLSSLTEATLDHVTISDCSATSIISGTSLPSLTLRTAVVERVQTPQPNFDVSNASKVEGLCHWTGGVIELTGCTCTVEGSRLTDLSEGGFRVDGGSVEIHSSTFEESHDESLFFPSAHRNIVCMNEGRVSINSPNGGDGSPGLPSLWMDSSNCTLTKNSQPITAPLFIPTLDTAKSTSTKTKKMMKLTLIGTLLMPCDLHLEVFSVEANKAETGAVQSLDLSSIGMDWTETSVTVELNETADFPNLKREHEWHGRLATRCPPHLLPDPSCSCFRKRKKNKEQKKTKLSEMGEINQPMDDIVKNDDPSMEMTDRLHHFSFDTPTEPNKTAEDAPNTKHSSLPDLPSERVEDFAEKKTNTTVIARGPDGKEVHIAQTKDTLYNRLHGPQPDEQLNRPQMRVQLVAALTAVHKHSPSAELLTRLNPHVVFDSAGVVCLQVNQHPQPQASDRGNQSKREEEFDRWKAPEVANGEVKVDHQQAAVFMNAQRQLGTGQLPPMDRITSESLVEMIEQSIHETAKTANQRHHMHQLQSPPSLTTWIILSHITNIATSQKLDDNRTDEPSRPAIIILTAPATSSLGCAATSRRRIDVTVVPLHPQTYTTHSSPNTHPASFSASRATLTSSLTSLLLPYSGTNSY
ncbi:hypothetical protein BLNAU_24776 [Blattamonas nauphoetae]|uniref:Uncharacterized protein n=1 Tax=Blattamonas nauphoetae TaxID=2049346 RepID=A0ABQ9WNJ9_9EUKA|nr:hypothetical protein BLNAU_24776 [Blattamonas nauphoetae]